MSLCPGKTQINPDRRRSAVLPGDQPRLFPCAAGRSGRWESGNPDFGFPLFHGSHMGPLVLVLSGERITVAGTVGMWKSPPLRFPSVRGNGGKPAVGFPLFPLRVISTAHRYSTGSPRISQLHRFYPQILLQSP